MNGNLRNLLYFNSYYFNNTEAPNYPSNPSIPDWSGLPTLIYPLGITLAVGYGVKIITENGEFIPSVPFEAYYIID